MPGLTNAGRPRVGRNERAINECAKAARSANMVSPWHAGAISAARTVARALDQAEQRRDGYLIARLVGELRQVLDGLGWLPEGGDRDDVNELIRLFSGPTVGNATQP